MALETLTSIGSDLTSPVNQINILSEGTKATFESKLDPIGLYPLVPTQLEILQVNVGKMCNQTCTHCHVDAGPDRTEIMTKETLQQCIDAAKNSSIQTIDITGGAPEMNPDFRWFVEELSKLGKKVIVRSNLTILTYKNYADIPEFFAKNKVNVVSSLPCYTEDNVDKQRGNGVFVRSIAALQRLNELGYGMEGTGLELDLVFNPGGASLPGGQAELKTDYKAHLKNHFNVEFNDLYTITNLPISRFLEFLVQNEKYDAYMDLLIDNFNPMAAEEVMCRNTISVSWDGNLYDCDFNQMLDLPVDNQIKTIANFNEQKLYNREIVLNRHCFGCTAGAGSSCQGSLT